MIYLPLSWCTTVEKRGCQRAARNVAHLQTHQVGEARRARPRADPPAQVPFGHLRPAQSQDGSAQVDGQCQHHHRHGKG